MAATPDSPGDDGTDRDLPRVEPAGEVAELQRPDLKKSKLGLIGHFLSYWWYRRKLRSKIDEGYVLWELIDDGRSGAKFVKPNYEGNGIPELEYDGNRYLFPPKARVPDKRTGMWFYRHQRGDAVPINLRHPDEEALDPGVLQRYRDMTPQTESPGWLSGLDLDAQDLVMYAVLGVGLLAVVIQFTGGM